MANLADSLKEVVEEAVAKSAQVEDLRAKQQALQDSQQKRLQEAAGKSQELDSRIHSVAKNLEQQQRDFDARLAEKLEQQQRLFEARQAKFEERYNRDRQQQSETFSGDFQKLRQEVLECRSQLQRLQQAPAQPASQQDEASGAQAVAANASDAAAEETQKQPGEEPSQVTSLAQATEKDKQDGAGTEQEDKSSAPPATGSSATAEVEIPPEVSGDVADAFPAEQAVAASPQAVAASPHAVAEDAPQERRSRSRQSSTVEQTMPDFLSAPMGAPDSSKSSNRITSGILVVLFVIFVVAALALHRFPFITVGLVGVTCSWFLYFVAEEPLIKLVQSRASTRPQRRAKKYHLLARALKKVQFLRSTQEGEHKMKSILFSFGTCGVLLNPDVGVLWNVVANFHPINVVLILAATLLITTYLAHVSQQWLHERSLRGHTFGDSTPLDQIDSIVQEKISSILSCLEERGRYQRRSSEKRIHQIFATMTDIAMLNQLIIVLGRHSDSLLTRVFDYLRDTAESDSRSQFMELLCMQKSQFLTPETKSVLIHTLMKGRLSSCNMSEAAIESLFLTTQGDELSELKSMMDGLGDIHSMHKLIYQDITDDNIRYRVLEHCLKEGITQVAQRTLLASAHFQQLLTLGRNKNCIPRHLKFAMREEGPLYEGSCGHSWLKIFTDMDDTLLSSGGKWPAGIDARYPRHALYPGVTTFYRELQGGGATGQLVALSARPHLVGEVMERKIFDKFRKMQRENSLHTMPGLLTGSLDTGSEFILSGGSEAGVRALARKKFESFKEFIALYPEFRVIFLGDNGQADYLVGQLMCRNYRNNVEQVWIHEVQPPESTWGYEPDSNNAVAFFQDYVDAAVSAVTRSRPLVTPDGFRRIVVASIEDFKKIDHWPSDGKDRDAAKARLNKSILRACEVLRNLKLDADIQLIDADKEKTVEVATDDSAKGSLFSSMFSRASGATAAQLVHDKEEPAQSSPGAAEVSKQTSDEDTEVIKAGEGIGSADQTTEGGGVAKSVSMFSRAFGLATGVTSTPPRKPEAEPTQELSPSDFPELAPLHPEAVDALQSADAAGGRSRFGLLTGAEPEGDTQGASGAVPFASALPTLVEEKIEEPAEKKEQRRSWIGRWGSSTPQPTVVPASAEEELRQRAELAEKQLKEQQSVWQAQQQKLEQVLASNSDITPKDLKSLLASVVSADAADPHEPMMVRWKTADGFPEEPPPVEQEAEDAAGERVAGERGAGEPAAEQGAAASQPRAAFFSLGNPLGRKRKDSGEELPGTPPPGTAVAAPPAKIPAVPAADFEDTAAQGSLASDAGKLAPTAADTGDDKPSAAPAQPGPVLSQTAAGSSGSAPPVEAADETAIGPQAAAPPEAASDATIADAAPEANASSTTDALPDGEAGAGNLDRPSSGAHVRSIFGIQLRSTKVEEPATGSIGANVEERTPQSKSAPSEGLQARHRLSTTPSEAMNRFKSATSIAGEAQQSMEEENSEDAMAADDQAMDEQEEAQALARGTVQSNARNLTSYDSFQSVDGLTNHDLVSRGGLTKE